MISPSASHTVYLITDESIYSSTSSPQDVLEGILDVDVAVTQSEEFLHYASGGRLLPGSVPLAHRYGGHQVEFVPNSCS